MYTSSVATAEILTIGDELCRGEIVNTNAAWLGERLTDLGYHVRWQTSTTDDAADMAAAFRQAAVRATVVVVSGGLGPTEDDRTVDVVAELVGVAPSLDEPHRAQMAERFGRRGFAVTPNNLRQVRIPTGATVLANRNGLAPGFRVEVGAATILCLPGVPREMKRIFDEEAAPWLAARRGSALASARRCWRIVGLGESHVDHCLAGLLDGVPEATLHYRLAFPEILVTAVVRRPQLAEAEALLDTLDGEVQRRLGGAAYGRGDETLALVMGRRLRAAAATVATAESCTGGLIGDLITDVAGSSDYYRGGVIAYSNQLKEELLGVRAETLRDHGAVSEACVIEMAEGVRRRVGATYGVAVSGIAGPGGGSDDKPAGLVHFAVAGPGGTEARRLLWPGERRLVKQISAFAALNLLDKILAPERRGAPDLTAPQRAGARP